MSNSLNIKAMKKILYSLVILFLCSCEGLDQLPKDSISPETYFFTENDLRLFTNGFYDALPSAEGVYNESADNIIKNSLTDEVRGSRLIPTSGGGWTWTNLRRINYYLQNSHKCTDKKARIRYDALARFFRAYFYSGMVQRFGDVPWINTAMDSNDKEAMQKPRDSRVLIVDSIISDLDYAIKELPTSKKVNEISRWTALALKAKVCLSEGTFRKYHDNLGLPGATELLTEAVTAAEELMTDGGYKKYTSTPDKAYGELFSSLTPIESEIILARCFSDDLTIRHNLNYYTTTSSYGKPGLEKAVVNLYLMSDGSRFTDIPGYNTKDFYEETQGRDPRLSQTIRTPGYTRIGETVTRAPDFGASVSGYQLIKFVTEPKYDQYNISINPMPIFRYAETLLIFAEAKAELGTLTQEDLDKSIKLLRDRAGMLKLEKDVANANPDPYLAAMHPNVTGVNKGVILEIRRERGIELVMENFRYADLMRWKNGSLVTRTFKGMYFPGIGSYDLDKNGTIDVIIYDGEKPSISGPVLLKLNEEIVLENGTSGLVLINSDIDKKFDETKDYLYPIPIQERLLNNNLTQNPGWKDGLSF